MDEDFYFGLLKKSIKKKGFGNAELDPSIIGVGF